MAHRSVVVALCGALAVTSLLAAADLPPSRREAETMKQKVAAISTPSKQRRRTVISENEVNAYFMFDAMKDLPTGVVNPSISIVGPGRISGRAVVDLDAVRRESPPKGLLDPKNLFIGRVPLTATGVLTTSGGKGTFILESASVGGLPLPKQLLQDILTHYSRSGEKPGGINLDDPFPLPAGIREIEVTRGQAVIIQ